MRYLRPTGPIAADALLPGDPKRAMELATALMDKPVMSNLSRGLWGYHGRTGTGHGLTVQSTGIGGPSAALVVAELAELGVRRAIRIGTCVALDPGLRPGDTIAVSAALAGEGAGAALAESDPVLPAAGLSAALAASAAPSRAGVVASTDLHYDPGSPRHAQLRAAGALAVDLSAAALLAAAERTGIAAGCALVVAASAAGESLTDDELDDAALALGERAAVALAGDQDVAAPEGASLS